MLYDFQTKGSSINEVTALGGGVSMILWRQYLSPSTKKRDEGGGEGGGQKLSKIAWRVIHG